MTFKTYLRSTVTVVAFLTLSGCQTADFNISSAPNSPLTEPNSAVNEPAQDNAIQTLVRKNTEALKAGKLKDASRFINLALKLDITNSDLQFLNGLTYHMMGVRGDASKFELAEQGYNQSLKFDPGNLSALYQLGLLYMDQRRYGLAQGYFAAVALHRSNDPAVLYNLASASYYARDPRTSEAALKRLMTVTETAKDNPDILKAAILSLSAMNDREGAAGFLAAYRNNVSDNDAISLLESRVSGWQSFYDSDAKIL